MRFFDRRSRARRGRVDTERAGAGAALGLDAPAADRAAGPDAGLDTGLDTGLGELDLGLAQAVDAAMALAIDAAIRAPVRVAPEPDDEEPAEPADPVEPGETAEDGSGTAEPEPGEGREDDDTDGAADVDESEGSEEEPEEVLITGLAPADVTADLANRLSALDRIEMGAAGRTLATISPRDLLDKIRGIAARVWVAGALSRPVGWAALSTVAEGAVLHGTIAGTDRRQGLATRMLAEVLEYAREADYPAITATVWLDTPAEEFALAHGFGPASQPPTVVRYQDLYATTERRRRIEEDAISYGASYEFATAEEVLGDGGGTVYRVIAQHVITGIFAGSAELTVTEGAPEFALNGMVRVEPGHRGHRLGTLMSVELIAYVQRTAKKVRMVQVTHPVSDTYITAILDRLGFRVAGRQLEHRLLLG